MTEPVQRVASSEEEVPFQAAESSNTGTEMTAMTPISVPPMEKPQDEAESPEEIKFPTLPHLHQIVAVAEPAKEEAEEETKGFNDKLGYILTQIGFAVGLGNVWRFPYLCQKYGGGAFIFPYAISLVLLGFPLYYLEVSIGQRFNAGSLLAWLKINPFFVGIGWASFIVCCYIAVYYNVIITWAVYHLYYSIFGDIEVWRSCPTSFSCNNASIAANAECLKSSPADYFFYNEVLEVSGDMNTMGHLVPHLTVCLVVSWISVCALIFGGVEKIGQITKFVTLYPYVVLSGFLAYSLTLNGSSAGITYMFTPDWSLMKNHEVWTAAATQIFFSLGLGFGGVISFSSYNSRNNNCFKDAVIVTAVNAATSIFATLVVFAICGYRAFNMSNTCISQNLVEFNSFLNASSLPEVATEENFLSIYKGLSGSALSHVQSHHPHLDCSIETELSNAQQGPSLAFVVFSEAIATTSFPRILGVCFFSMIISLGFSSMIGTMEGVRRPLREAGIRLSDQSITILSGLVFCTVGMFFVTQNGSYILDIFDNYSATVPLLLIASMEVIAVHFYGVKKFKEDVDEMISMPEWMRTPYKVYFYSAWYVVSPLVAIILFVMNCKSLLQTSPTYSTGVTGSGPDGNGRLDYPGWAMAFTYYLVLSSTSMILIHMIRRKWIQYSRSQSATLPTLAADAVVAKSAVSEKL